MRPEYRQKTFVGKWGYRKHHFTSGSKNMPVGMGITELRKLKALEEKTGSLNA